MRLHIELASVLEKALRGSGGSAIDAPVSVLQLTGALMLTVPTVLAFALVMAIVNAGLLWLALGSVVFVATTLIDTRRILRAAALGPKGQGMPLSDYSLDCIAADLSRFTDPDIPDLTLSDEEHQRISDAGSLHELNPHAYTYT